MQVIFRSNQILLNGNGFTLNDDSSLDASCGCYACNNSVEQGHFKCSSSEEVLLEAEKQNIVQRSYSNSWKWFYIPIKHRA